MKILKKTWSMGRDFAANMVCEGCKKTDTLLTGYDDHYYHDHVIPNIKCKHCGKSRKDIENGTK